MKKNKVLTILIITIAAVVALISISVVVAYMFKQSPEFNNEFVPAVVDCKVVETFVESKKTSVKVENTGNIRSYIRLRVVTYWQDSKGNPVARTSPEIEFGTQWKYDESEWIYDEENKTFYHKAPVDAGKETSELLALGSDFSGIQLSPVVEEVSGVNYTYHPVIVFIAEAIQSEPGSAVKKWDVTVDSAGNITAIN